MVKRVTDVEPGGLHLTSDNPEEGSDSRSWGLVAPDNVVGVVTLVMDRPTTGPVLRR